MSEDQFLVHTWECLMHSKVIALSPAYARAPQNLVNVAEVFCDIIDFEGLADSIG